MLYTVRKSCYKMYHLKNHFQLYLSEQGTFVSVISRLHCILQMKGTVTSQAIEEIISVCLPFII